MITLRPGNERGFANHGWLQTHHSFSFGEYYNPAHMGFRTLRVINDDIIQPGKGFGTHGHQDMEIITYMVEGALEHKDSMGSGSVLRAGDVQYMSAGSGVTHSEFNHSDTDALRLLQIWILPEKRGIEPGYQEKNFPREDKHNRLRLIASPSGEEGSLSIHQDVRLFASILDPEETLTFKPAPDRHQWLQMIEGGVTINGKQLEAGDGVAVSQEKSLTITGQENSEFLLFDLN